LKKHGVWHAANDEVATLTFLEALGYSGAIQEKQKNAAEGYTATRADGVD
jgi:hypothetical protein